MSQEREPAWRRIPPVVLVLAAAIVVAYIPFSFLNPYEQQSLFNTFGVVPLRYEPNGPMPFANFPEALMPLVGHVFLHGGWLHLGMNMLVFVQAGPFVASRLGARRFLVLFFVSALGAAGAYILINAHSETPAVGASGAICGVFGAYFLSVRRSWQEALADPQVRNAAFLFLFINVFLAGLASVSGFLPIAWEAHLGGFVTGALVYLVMAPRLARGPWG